MAFRFKIEIEEAEPTFTLWYDEPLPTSAGDIASKVRAANPDAALYIQRQAQPASELNPPNGG